MIHNLLDEPSEILENGYEIITRVPTHPIQNFVHFVHVTDFRSFLGKNERVIELDLEVRISLEKNWTEILSYILSYRYNKELEDVPFFHNMVKRRELNHIIISTFCLEVFRQASKPGSVFYPGTVESIQELFPELTKIISFDLKQ